MRSLSLAGRTPAVPSVRIVEVAELGRQALPVEPQHPDGPGQPEAARPGAARVEEEGRAEPRPVRPVGVAEDDDVGPQALDQPFVVPAELMQLAEDVPYQNATTAQTLHPLGG